MRRAPIRLKVLGALAVPSLMLLCVVYVEVSNEAREVGEVRRQTDLATALIGPQGVLTSIQDERNWTVVELIGMEGAIALEHTGYRTTRDRTDEAVTDFVAEVASLGGQVAEEYAPAIDALDGLDAIRQTVDDYPGPRTLDNLEFGSEIFTAYAGVIDVFLGANTRLALEVDHRDLRSGAELVDVSSRQIELVATLAHITLTSVGGFSNETRVELAALLEDFTGNAARLKVHDRGPYHELVTSGFPEDFTADMMTTIEGAISTGAVDTNEMLALLDVEDADSYVRFVHDASVLLDGEGSRLVSAATRSQRIYVTLATLVVLLTALACWIAARSITRPLRSLTRQATTMADERLPRAVENILKTRPGEDVALSRLEPVKVVTRDETADVADALSTVQEAALDLAVEQTMLRRNIADSFVNLGRRNQNLLSRQLDFITELEQNETDAEVLADLFRLDHLATRMRRNAESLLVLADVETPRKWATPVKITHVIRAALGEVEDFQRVMLHSVEPATVTGTAAADLAHLLAELLENALVFSPPHHDVEIRGYRTREIPNEGYALAIVDTGLGLSPDELNRANRRLAGAESFTVAPSKYLGHYVAGNLAERHGIRIELRNSPGGEGITAVTHLPHTVLAADEEAAANLHIVGGLRTETISRLGNGNQPAAVPAQPTVLATRARPVPQAEPPGGASALRVPPLPRRIRADQPPRDPRPPVDPAPQHARMKVADPVRSTQDEPVLPSGPAASWPLGEPFHPPSRRQAPPGREPGTTAAAAQKKSPHEVRSFLADFTTGIRQGLDEVRRSRP